MCTICFYISATVSLFYMVINSDNWILRVQRIRMKRKVPREYGLSAYTVIHSSYLLAMSPL